MQIEELYKLYCKSTGVCTDTRKIETGNLFFALKGPNFNANNFAKKAIEKGAIVSVIDEPQYHLDRGTFLVDNTLETLQQLALFHRRKFACPVLAITGSNGKTTTRELSIAVLNSSYKTYGTSGNLNNHIGVPLTLLSIPLNAEMVVVELGANHLNENKLLCEIAEPDFGLITNNGKDHLEGYGGLEGVRKGNGEVYEYLKSKKNTTVFVSAFQPDLLQMSEGMNRVIYGSHEQSCVTAHIVDFFPYLKISVELDKEQYSNINTNLAGRYNLENILAAIAIGKFFNIDFNKIKKSIENYKPTNNRSQILEWNNSIFVLDCYNANPSSMIAALETFSDFKCDKKIAVLGDMAELGIYSENEHKLILDYLKNNKPDEVWLLGSEFKKALREDTSNEFKWFDNIDDLKIYFQSRIFNGYYFLLKGSRVNHLERMLDQNR